MKFQGLIYIKHGRVGSRSEGPDYWLQTTSGTYQLQYKQRYPWEPDYNLEFFSRAMVAIEGELRAPRLIEVKRIEEILSPRLPPVVEGGPIQLKQGESTKLPRGEKLTFLEVTEDSRCPPDVMCVWEGQATVKLRLDPPGPGATDFTLTARGGNPDLATKNVGGYQFILQDLDPPNKPDQASVPYVMTLLVRPVA